jgi:hypothetical protein
MNGRQMQQGVVKFFREDRGYGFIERDQGGDLFVVFTVVAAWRSSSSVFRTAGDHGRFH